ncbi:TerB family tellurite resistance protein [Myxococcota bacterium]|nr:TerB family tellurite resistance protein [Myxococcota bacterium]
MAISIENLLRSTEFSADDKNIILRGIAQLAAADGVIDPREREYLKKFVTEFFPQADPNDPKLVEDVVTAKDVTTLSSDEVRMAFAGFLTITAYADENFSQPEREFIKGLFVGSLGEKQVAEVQHSVRMFLYRRVVFAFALKNRFLHPEFAIEMSRRFDISTDEAIEINQGVFSAIMAIRGASEEEIVEATAQ